MSARHEAARAMLEARARLQSAEIAAGQAAVDYAAAEEAFLNVSDPVGGVEATNPPNLLIDSTLIMPSEEWYDKKPGMRVSFHTV